MKQVFEFKENKTFFGLDIYTQGVKLSDISRLPFAQFFNDSHVGSTMLFIDGENYIYKHDWERFCKGFILSGKHRYIESFSNKESKLYRALCEVLNDKKDIDILDIGESSKRILRKLLEVVENEEGSEIKSKLLKMYKLNLSSAKDIILECKMNKKW